MKTRLICASAALVCLCAGPALGQETRFVLVENGVCRAPLVVDAEAAPWTRRAAEELADYVEKITGARPPILTGRPDPLPARAVWVGPHPALAELLPDLDLHFRHPEEIVIAARENHLVIAGRDVRDPNIPSVRGRFDVEVTDWQQAYGSANAVYTFIHDYLDVRWLWPGELGEDLVKRDTLAFPPFTFRYQPPFRLRSGIFLFSSLGDNRGRAHDWARRQRVQLDSSRTGTSTRLGSMIGGHAFGAWWSRFHETNPEYFALQPDGTRSGWPSPDNAKLCQSNPAVHGRWLADAEETLRREPDRLVFNASPNDGHSSGICVCANCLARDHREGQAWPYNWQGTSQQYVAMSDRYLAFANDLARGLRERFPAREDLYALMFAYGPSTPPPVAARAEPNVMIGYVGFFPLTTEASRREQKAQWAAWARTAQAMAYRPNLWYWGGGVWGLPEIALEETAEDFRFLADHNCFGIYVDYNAEHWGTMLPQYYLMARLGWDPYADAGEIMTDWYRRGFGPAARSVEAYWTMLGEARREMMAHPGVKLGARYRMEIAGAMREVYNPDFLARSGALLDRAAAETAGGPEIFRRRLALVRAGYDFTCLMFRGAALMERVRASEGRDADAVKQALAVWEEIGALGKREPLAFNTTYVHARVSEGDTSYMGGVGDFFGPPSEKYRRAAGLE